MTMSVDAFKDMAAEVEKRFLTVKVQGERPSVPFIDQVYIKVDPTNIDEVLAILLSAGFKMTGSKPNDFEYFRRAVNLSQDTMLDSILGVSILVLNGNYKEAHRPESLEGKITGASDTNIDDLYLAGYKEISIDQLKEMCNQSSVMCNQD